MKKKRGFKIAGILAAGIFLMLIFLVVFLTIREYRPDAVEDVTAGTGTGELKTGDSFTILTYNIGYGGLDKEEDFFMDGGKGVRAESEDVVRTNLNGITSTLKEQDADVYFLQEVDLDSNRSYHVDEQEYLEEKMGISSMFAYNFKCDFVPYPLPPIGKVESGLLTMTDLKVAESSRIALPESFQWPIKTCNLKRCMLEARIPLGDTDKELVLINFHLEAYDSGEGKIAQSKMLSDKLKEEYDKGNYVIAGGDFNQTFEGMDTYEIHDKDSWVPGLVSKDDIPEGVSFAVSDNAPTCRLLNGPYSGNYEDSQVYVIDGFIVSDNLSVEQVENIDTQFEYTDHQPVRMEVVIEK